MRFLTLLASVEGLALPDEVSGTERDRPSITRLANPSFSVKLELKCRRNEGTMVHSS